MTTNRIGTIRLLVVSRDPAVLRQFWFLGESNAWHLETAASPWDAMERVQYGLAPHLLLLDLPQGDSDSLHILRWLRRLRPDLRLIVLCHADDVLLRNEAIRLGAGDVLVRPFQEGHLEFLIRLHLSSPPVKAKAQITSEDIEQIGEKEFFLTVSPVMQKLREQLGLLAQADVPLLITGESGSGKSTVAQLIHKLSVRSGFKFLKVKCGAMPGDLLEAELFGSSQEESAGGGRPGKLTTPGKSTIFLDEITAIPLGLQDRLLGVLQNRQFVRTGEERPVEVDVRIVGATSANVERALIEKRLREDFYHRLSAFTVHVPALRERKEEIEVLLRYFMHRLAQHYGLPPREFAPAMLEACKEYSWPRNLTELEALAKRYLVVGNDDFGLREAGSGEKDAKGSEGRLHLDEDRERASEGKSLKSLVEDVKSEAEKNAIGAALVRTGWNRKAAARLLQVSYRTLLYKIEEYQLSSSDPFPATTPRKKDDKAS